MISTGSTEGDLASEPTVERRTPLLRFFGFAFIEAWVMMLFSSSVLFPVHNDLVSIPTIHTVTTGVAILAAVILLVFSPQICPISLKRNMNLIIGVLGSLGGLLIVLADYTKIDIVWMTIGFVLSTFGATWLELSWQEHLATQGVRTALIANAVLTLLGTFLYLLVSILPTLVSISLSLTFPLIAAISLAPDSSTRLFFASQKDKTADATLISTIKGITSFFSLGLLSLITLMGFIYGAVRTMGMSTDPNTTSSLIWLFDACGAVLSTVVACTLAASLHKGSAKVAFYIAIPASALGAFIYMLPFSWNAEVSFLLISAGDSITQMIIWALLIDLASRKHKPVIGFFSALFIMSSLGSLVGQLVSIIPGIDWRILCSICELVALAGALVLSGFKSPLAVLPQSMEKRPMEPQEVMMNELAERYGLSGREREVLTLWLTGHNSTYVADMLSVSKNTIKTHLTHIYSKTSTENREQLLQLMEKMDSKGETR